jgi:hypothetical protein
MAKSGLPEKFSMEFGKKEKVLKKLKKKYCV